MKNQKKFMPPAGSAALCDLLMTRRSVDLMRISCETETI
jgi:hypothetical protein